MGPSKTTKLLRDFEKEARSNVLKKLGLISWNTAFVEYTSAGRTYIINHKKLTPISYIFYDDYKHTHQEALDTIVEKFSEQLFSLTKGK
jgi:hypothetical protein